MDFKLSENHQQLQEMYREFAQNEVKPLAKEIDETMRFPKENVEKMAEMGLMGIPFPEELGGAGMDTLSYVQCVEELSKCCASTGIIVSVHTSLSATPIYNYGTEEQKQKYLKPLASGEMLGAFALTEPSAGTDASMGKTTAVLEGDHYVLNGSKIFITNAGHADVYVVLAMTDKEKGT
ncbi:MAG: acyl-CoA dehydrogenase family protein, partial [Clostridiaceae bacterium]